VNNKSDERAKPMGGLPTPQGVQVERKEGRVASQNESVGGKVKTFAYDRNSRE
jgi:hypothetical protein